MQMNLRATTCHFLPGESRDIITASTHPNKQARSGRAVPRYRRFIYLRADSPRPVRGLHRQVVIRFLLGVQGPRDDQGPAGLAHVKAAVIITTCGVRRRRRQKDQPRIVATLSARSDAGGGDVDEARTSKAIMNRRVVCRHCQLSKVAA